MSNMEKATHIHAYLERISRYPLSVSIEDICEKSSTEELDFYFHWCCNRI